MNLYYKLIETYIYSTSRELLYAKNQLLAKILDLGSQ